MILWVLLAALSAHSFDVSSKIVGVRAGSTLAYIVVGEHVVLIDAGSDPHGVAILAELRRLGRDPNDVVAILLTHAHRDATAALALFPKAVTYVSEADHLLLRGDRHVDPLWVNILSRFLPAPELPSRIQSIPPSARLSFASMHFEAIALPGHTDGSVAYLHDHILFSGDSLLLEGNDVTPASWWTSEHANAQVLKRLVAWDFRGIADARTGYAADGRARFDSWVQSRLTNTK